MFDTKAQERLGYYVYALFDPRQPRWPFYIGKGRGNRVFAHAGGSHVVDGEDELLNQKAQLIANIKHSGYEVIHKIIRFGLSEEEAFKVEAALIDMVNHIQPDTLTNQISGQGVAEGFYDARDLATSLGAEELQPEIPMLLIKIERQWTTLLEQYCAASAIPKAEIYQATKGAWKLSISRTRKAECVLSVARGLVRAVFVPTAWTDSGQDNRKVMVDIRDSAEYERFVGCSVAHLFERGSQNPIRYIRC